MKYKGGTYEIRTTPSATIQSNIPSAEMNSEGEMSKSTLSRRTFLATAAGLSTAALFGRLGRAASLDPPPDLPYPVPDWLNTLPQFTRSPALPGPYQTGRVILGEDSVASTYAVRQYFKLNEYPGFPAYFLADQR